MSKINKIKKRDDIVVSFDKDHIADAIFKAIQSIGGKDKELASKLADKVVETMERETPKNTILNTHTENASVLRSYTIIFFNLITSL